MSNIEVEEVSNKRRSIVYIIRRRKEPYNKHFCESLDNKVPFGRAFRNAPFQECYYGKRNAVFIAMHFYFDAVSLASEDSFGTIVNYQMRALLRFALLPIQLE